MTRWPAPPPLDGGELRELGTLDEATCWDRLAGVAVGRIAVVVRGDEILVVPVNFRVDGRTIVFRTGQGAVTKNLRRRATFEADAFDENRRVGWSVLVHGFATVSTWDADQGGAPCPWPSGRRSVLVRIDVDRMSGRVLRELPYESDLRGYL